MVLFDPTLFHLLPTESSLETLRVGGRCDYPCCAGGNREPQGLRGFRENVEAEKDLCWALGPGSGVTLTGCVILSKR